MRMPFQIHSFNDTRYRTTATHYSSEGSSTSISLDESDDKYSIKEDSIDLKETRKMPWWKRIWGNFKSLPTYETTDPANFGTDSSSKKRGKKQSYIRWAALITLIGLLGWLIFGFSTSRSLRHPFSSQLESDSTFNVATDPRLSSELCDVPRPGRPLIQYVLMVDAGSTGSRIHVYKFNYCKSQPQLESEVLFKEVKPGLSSAKDPIDAAHSLDPLMDAAMEVVPLSLQHCTPLAVKATAGLRLLGEERSAHILEAVQRHLETRYSFPLISHDPVSIMNGKDEGIYAWITVNSLLGTLGKNGTHRTAATFDLGGGSTQIVFEPRQNSTLAAQTNSISKNDPDSIFQLPDGEHKEVVNYSGQRYELYQHSYLGYGLMSARQSIKEHIGREMNAQGKSFVHHPCFPANYKEEVVLKPIVPDADDTGHMMHNATRTVVLQGVDEDKLNNPSKSGNPDYFEQCQHSVDSIFNKNEQCDISPCTFNGVYQPPLDDAFDVAEPTQDVDAPFYIFSYFYDRTHPMGLRDSFTIADMKELAEQVCRHRPDELPDGPSGPGSMEVKSEPMFCMDLVYQIRLLTHGVGLPENRMVRSARKINDVETGWCLGAALAVLDQNSYCKA